MHDKQDQQKTAKNHLDRVFNIIFLMKNMVCMLSLLTAVFSVQAKEQTLTILFLGDSITEGYGINPDEAYAQLIARKINHDFRHQAKKISIIQDGVSGATSASALGRLKWQLRVKNTPKIMVLALGANDGLRGLDPSAMYQNLASTIALAERNNMIVILTGMRVLPNYGKQYAQNYEAAFLRLSQQYRIIFMPFLLHQVAGKPQYNIADGVHPNEKGHQIIAENLYPLVKKALQRLGL